MTSPRIIGHMVVRNELERYLRQSLPWLARLCDTVTVYDDRSTDGTFEYIWDSGHSVGLRPPAEPSFIQDESAFREAAWRHMEGVARPRDGDWVLCVDADEFLLATDPLSDPKLVLADIVSDAIAHHDDAVSFWVAEVFAIDGRGRPLVRADGFWMAIQATRLVRWRPGARFATRREGGGSVPTPLRTIGTRQLDLVHVGYLREKDRQDKYTRYSRGRGHSLRHVASILQRPVLVRWPGSVPEGIRP